MSSTGKIFLNGFKSSLSPSDNSNGAVVIGNIIAYIINNNNLTDKKKLRIIAASKLKDIVKNITLNINVNITKYITGFNELIKFFRPIFDKHTITAYIIIAANNFSDDFIDIITPNNNNMLINLARGSILCMTDFLATYCPNIIFVKFIKNSARLSSFLVYNI